VEDILRFGAGRADIILFRLARRGADAKDIAALARGFAGSRERRLETTGQGNAFAHAAMPWGLLPDDIGDLPFPVAVGLLTAQHDIDEDTAAAAFLQAFAANLISAAVRLVPLGQSQGLAVLASLADTVLDVTESTRDATEADLGGACFRSDIAAMRHETQYTRLFRS
jgi:urease accessory protein